ncbi:MAG: ADP-heptose--LPS heptosyltransferase [Alphaproteobacteria bacterium]|nr:ADP-heptose--LPS heptosyltransferase [Alphaproteobacteria bacterium]
MEEKITKILVIKLSALGDFIQAMGPMAAIRRHHPNAHITLMTTASFKEFAQRCGYFDMVMIDQRPKFFNVLGLLSLRKQLLDGRYDRVYDLQNNDRTELYLKLFTGSKKPEWVGAAKGASHRNASQERTQGHALDGHRQTLALAGIKDIDIDKLEWIIEDLAPYNIPDNYALLVPGSAAQHPQKRWPAEKYAAIASSLYNDGITPVLLGTKAEKEVTQTIKSLCKNTIDLTGRTSLFEIAALAHKAKVAIGNDTGPMHIIAATGCPCLVLFSGHSITHRHAPKGQRVKVIQKENINDITESAVLSALKEI